MSRKSKFPVRTSVRQLSRDTQMAMRAEAIELIERLMKEEPRTAPELSQLTKVGKNTLNGYLRHLQRALRKIRPTSQTRNRAVVWELGIDPSLPTPDEALDQLFAVRRGTRPAVQIGMQRDPLVAALFGPANQEHKEAA
ncbi:hypothetical protein [Massilia sp. X63]|uniref:hypothetical protein n=1 Tax=Massilia sp. X63 TaxID=3237285 RepID=UPI0034DD1A7C